MDDHRHVESHHYARTVRGQQKPSVAGWMIVHGLLDGCPECRHLWEMLAGEQDTLFGSVRELDRTGPAAEKSPAPLPEPPPRAPHVAELQDEVDWLRIHRERWKRDLRELRRTPREARRAKLEAARARFASIGFAELLLDESRQVVRTDPAEAESLAELVPLVLERTAGANRDPRAASLAARAEAHRANALRIAGELPAAEEVFARLRVALVVRPLGDATTEAEAASLEASLRFDQRRFTEAEELLEKALLFYQRGEDSEGELRVEIKQAMLLYYQERYMEALPRLEVVAQHIDPGTHLHQLTSTVTARVDSLCCLERWEQASELLESHLDAFELVEDEAAGAMLRGLQGRIALGRRQFDVAEEAFASCRDAFLSLGRSYDALLASLYLACVHLEAGDARALRRLTAELPPTFRVRGVGREALAALGLLVKAVAAEELTRELLEKLLRQVERSRHPSPPLATA